MAKSALDDILEMVGSLAGEAGMPTYGELRGQLEQAVSNGDFRAEGDLRQQIGSWLYSIGSAACVRADAFPIDATEVLELAAEHLQRSAACARRAGNAGLERLSLCLMGRTLFDMRRLDEAQETFEAALAVSSASRNLTIEYESVHSLGDCFLETDDDSAALERYRQALDLARELGDPSEEATQLGKAASALEKLGRFGEAIALYEQSRD
ncbi:MAG: tetratricopeptide repeat protein, partial [Verrucomicrobia bacterium]|nr:tetratricopeptide repeat protein [Verrucomicrobiota bacterium]